MSKTQRDFIEKRKYFIGALTFTVIAGIVMVIVVALNFTIKGNVIERVTDESKFLAEQQAELINKTVEEQFHKISTISGMVENGLSFFDAGDQKILKIFVEKNEIRMLAFADANGDVITYQGQKIGNISNRDYFSQIMDGQKEYVCQYLKTTLQDSEPKIVFATAVYQNGKIQGIVFFSKDVAVLRDNMFEQSMFNTQESSLVVDKTGDILVKNKKADKTYAEIKNVYDIYSKNQKTKEMFQKVNSGSMVLGENDEMVLAYSSIGQNDWYLVCLIDTDIARQEYSSSLMSIQRLVLFLSLCFLIGIIYIASLLVFQMKNTRTKYKESKKRYERIIALLTKMHCMIVEYDLNSGKIDTNELFEETFGYGIEDQFFEQLSKHRKNHPEFDYDGFIRELKFAVENKQTTSIEVLYCKNEYSYKILSIIMMPILDEEGKVTQIVGCVRENGVNHKQIKEKVDMFSQIPGGTHRCYLSDPIHLDYVGEKLAAMLGYTVEEFRKAAGRSYVNVIVEEDREKFIKFVNESAAAPGVRKCQYDMRCKNGEILSVLDTMESIKNDSGVMYGYSVVVDISEYVKRQNIIRQEMKQLEQNLEIMRINNSASQMQPHFIYNALSSIREVVLTDPNYASDLIYDFTVYLRACIRTMKNGDLISVQQEMDNICAYVNIEKMRMGERLKVEYNLKSEDFQVVPLSIQPLVENAIRHGIYNRGKKGGTVSVETRTLADCNMIIVKDDGIGFDYQKVRDEVERGERESIGLDNVMFRLKKQLDARVIIKSTIGDGTIIIVRIPKKGNNDESDHT